MPQKVMRLDKRICGGGHGWKDWQNDAKTVADWFDAHLVKKN
jgi:hypothetical protein